MFEKFTDRARRVLVIAQQEATSAGHDEITPDHMLLGCVVERDGIAGSVLDTFSIAPERVREHVVEVVPRRSSVSPVDAVAAIGIDLLQVKEAVEEAFGAGSFALPGERPPFAASGREVLQASLDASLEWRHNYIGTEHLLLGVLRTGAEARALLDALGVDADEVERRTSSVMHRYAVVEQQSNRERARDVRRGVQRLPADVSVAARVVLSQTVNAQPVMPIVASDAEFDVWLAATEAQLGTAVDEARDRLDSLGALQFVDAVASLMKTGEAMELGSVIDELRHHRDKLQASEADDEEAVDALAKAVQRERRATEMLDQMWEAVWSRRAEWPEADFVDRVAATTASIRALP